jgi:predicted MPP superfamily phosphohydrolase
MFHLILSLPWLIVAIRYIEPLPWSLPMKVALASVLLVASQYHLISRLSSGSVFSPEFPRPLVIGFNLLFGAIVFLAVFQIALDLVWFAIALIIWRVPEVPVEARYGLGLFAIALAAYGVRQAVRVPPVKIIEVEIRVLPKAFDGYRILQLTDLHISRLFAEAWTKEIVTRSNALDVDLTVITGDVIDGVLDARREDVAPLADLRAHDGVLAIPGNHEYYFGYESWMHHDAGLGMRMLLNENAVIRRGGDEIVIAGVTDLAALGSSFPAPDLDAALENAPGDKPIILLAHQPRMAARAAAAAVVLQLSGHTHGGMVRGLDRLVARSNDGYVSGMYKVGGMQLYVNNGTGLWPGFALRLGVPSELTVITLRAKP